MKKNIKWILILLAVLIVAGITVYILFFSNSSNNTNNYYANRLSTNIQDNNFTNNINNNENVETEIKSATEDLNNELASFSTKIIDEDNNRDNNMKISISKLNGTIVKSGDTFSFNETVGSPTPDRGYKKAGVFVKDKLKKDYGGGNCQVSSTLYNAVLKVDDLEVVERHEHTLDVYYVPQGKDAAVAYGELDFKFKNNTGNDIIIYGEVTEKEVKVKICNK